MTLVKKRALISSVAALAVVAGNAIVAPAASAADAAPVDNASVTTDTTQESTEAAPPVASTTDNDAENSGTGAATNADADTDTSNAESAETATTTPDTATSENNAAPQGVTTGSTAAPTTTEPEKPTLVWIDKGFANWDFKKSFREYVGLNHEERLGMGLVDGSLNWYPKNDQKFNTAAPTQVRFGGEVEWQKYSGLLHIKLSNPTINFQDKKLYIDAYTKGTLAGGGELTVTQQPLLEMEDLGYEVKDGYIVIHSFRPKITNLARQIFGFYAGEIGAPFVATLEARELGSTPAPQPILSDLFPEQFPRTGNGPIIDDSEPIRDILVPDVRLRQCILDDLDLKEGTPITNKVIQRIQALNCISVREGTPKIESLEGLQFAKNLTSIRFSYNNITDLSPLAHMTWLKSLELENNAIRSLRPLAELTKLTRIDVSNNKITSLAGLEKLTGLERLVAENNRIASLEGLPPKGEEFNILHLSNNRIESLEPLAGLLWLREVYVDNNRITSVAGLDKIRGVRKLKIQNNYITDPSHFAVWGDRNHVETMYVSKNQFTDWSVIDNAKSKIRDWPEDPTQALNPVSLDEAKAKDAQIDAADPDPNAPKAEEPTEDNSQSAAEDPSKENSTEAPVVHHYSGSLNWGLRTSFTDYIQKDFVGGKWELFDGVTGQFIFPLREVVAPTLDGLTSVSFGGKVHFTGHNGKLDFSLAEPQIVKTDNGWKLTAVVSSRPFNPKDLFGQATGSLLRSARADSKTTLPPAERVTFADLSAPSIVVKDDSVTYSFDKVSLTAEGEQAFGGFYTGANNGLDPIVLTVTRTVQSPDNSGSDQGTTDEGKTDEGTTGQGKTDEGTTGQGKTDEGKTDEGTTSEGKTDDTTRQCHVDPTTYVVSDGGLTWNFRDSFLAYLTGNIAQGKWDLTDMTWNGQAFTFPAKSGSYSVRTHQGVFTYGGTVQFTGHQGKLDLTMSNPELHITGTTGVLYLTVEGKDFVGKPLNAGKIPFAKVTLNTPKINGATVDFTTKSVTLTAEGNKVFAEFYGVDAPMSPFTSTLTMSPKRVCEGDISDPGPLPAPKPAPKPAPQDGADGNQSGDQAQSGTAPTPQTPTDNQQPTPKKPDPKNPQHKDEEKKKECVVDPHKMRVTSGTLSWGVRSSFTSYIRGSIAKGGWDLNGVSWDGSNFNFPASGGLYNLANRSGKIYYSGSIHFYGHNGILDVTMSNPTVEITGNSGALYLTVAGSDMQGNKFNLGRVHFANLGIGTVNASAGSLSFDGASVSLTAEGAKAFAGFYNAGQDLAPLSVNANLTHATSCDDEGNLIELDAFGNNAGPAGLASTGSEAGILIALSVSMLIMGLAATRRRATHSLAQSVTTH